MAEIDDGVNLEDHGSNGEQTPEEYELLVRDLEKKGIVADGDKIAREGMRILDNLPGRVQAINLIASVPRIDEVFKDKAQALLADLISRTNYFSREERLLFLDYVSDCLEFGVPLDNAIRYAISARSENGQAIDDLITVLTTFNHKQSYANNQGPDKRKPKTGIFS